MATVNKNFKVKNGLDVALGATFGEAITVGGPTSENHATTKSYVDSLVGTVFSGPTAPSSLETGKMWFDTELGRLKIYSGSEWTILPNFEDTTTIPQHIHDTSIGGTGLVVTTFTEGGSSSSAAVNYLDGGGPGTTTWEFVLDGGSAVDNYS